MTSLPEKHQRDIPLKIRQYPGLLQKISPTLSRSNLRLLSRIVKVLLAMTGRVTMLGLSRWTVKGGSNRTVPRFFGEQIDWMHSAGSSLLRSSINQSESTCWVAMNVW